MYDEIKRSVEQRISERPRFRIERVATVGKDGDRSLLSSHVTSELERRMKEMYDDTDASEAGAAGDTVRQFGGLRTRRQLEKHFVERLSVDVGNAERAFDFTVPSGSKVLGSPYDLDWAEGNGVALGARIDGKVFP